MGICNLKRSDGNSQCRDGDSNLPSKLLTSNCSCQKRNVGSKNGAERWNDWAVINPTSDLSHEGRGHQSLTLTLMLCFAYKQELNMSVFCETNSSWLRQMQILTLKHWMKIEDPHGRVRVRIEETKEDGKHIGRPTVSTTLDTWKPWETKIATKEHTWDGLRSTGTYATEGCLIWWPQRKRMCLIL